MQMKTKNPKRGTIKHYFSFRIYHTGNLVKIVGVST